MKVPLGGDSAPPAAALVPGVRGEVFVLLYQLKPVTVRTIGDSVATAEVLRVTIICLQGPLRSSVGLVLTEDILDKDSPLGLAWPTGSCGDSRFSRSRSQGSCITEVLYPMAYTL